MQMIAKSVKFCFYTEYAPKSDRESELNLSFDKEKDKLALGFFKAILQALRHHKDKSADIKFAFIVKFTLSLPLKNYRKYEINSIFGKVKRDFALALF